MPHVLITEAMHSTGLDILNSDFSVTYEPHLFQYPEKISDAVQSADALIIRNLTQITPALLSHAPHLKVIGRLGVGLDNVDIPSCRNHNVTVVSARGANAIAVAEYVFAYMFSVSRHISAVNQSVHDGHWDRTLGGFELYGKTLGLVGLGDIGLRIAARASVFGMTVLAYDPFQIPTHYGVMDVGVKLSDLDSVLEQSDFVSLHVPLTTKTKNLMTAPQFALMKPTAYLINTARGGILNENTLLEAIQSDQIAGALLDVRTQEPPPSPDLLAHEPKICLSPHISGLTREAGIRTATMIASDVARVLKGEPAIAKV